MADFIFENYSSEVKEELERTITNWLEEWGGEIASQAKRNVSREGWNKADRTQLRDSYRHIVDESKKEALIGTPLEQGFWEEWGTGEYAHHGDGRKGWWIYIEGEASMGGGQTYATQEEAEMMAAYIREKYNKNAIATNGREPNYTLEKAFKKAEPKAQADLENKLKESLGK